MVNLKLLQPKTTNIYAIVKKNDVFVAKICKYALYESSEGSFCARRKPANFCHPGLVISYNAESFLKARGWMELMLSPLSQVILAKLAFLTSPSCFSENGAGLAAES